MHYTGIHTLSLDATQQITGLGFQPTNLIVQGIYSYLTTNKQIFSIGRANGIAQNCNECNLYTRVAYLHTGKLASFDTIAITLISLDPDGFTIGLTGTPMSAINLIFTAMRP